MDGRFWRPTISDVRMDAQRVILWARTCFGLVLLATTCGSCTTHSQGRPGNASMPMDRFVVYQAADWEGAPTKTIRRLVVNGFDKTLLGAVRECTSLTELDLGYGLAPTDKDITNLLRLPKLQSIRVSNGSQLTGTFANESHEESVLRSISIYGVRKFEESNLYKLSRLPQLTSVDIAGQLVASEVAKNPPAAFPDNWNRLRVAGWTLPSGWVLDALVASKGLRVVQLDNTLLGGSLADSLSRQGKVMAWQQLDLSDPSMSNEAVEKILRYCPNVQILKLQNIAIGSQLTQRILDLAASGTLNDLDLSFSELEMAVVRTERVALDYLVLNGSKCLEGDAKRLLGSATVRRGLRLATCSWLSDSVLSCVDVGELEALDVSGTKIRGEWLHKLVGKGSSLRSLAIRGCNVLTREDIAQLKLSALADVDLSYLHAVDGATVARVMAIKSLRSFVATGVNWVDESLVLALSRCPMLEKIDLSVYPGDLEKAQWQCNHLIADAFAHHSQLVDLKLFGRFSGEGDSELLVTRSKLRGCVVVG